MAFPVNTKSFTQTGNVSDIVQSTTVVDAISRMLRTSLLSGFSLLALSDLSYAQTVPQWKSYTVTGNPSDIVASTTVAAAIGGKVDTVGGVSTNQRLTAPNVTNATIDASSTIAGILASRLIGADASGNTTLPGGLTNAAGQFNAPQSGSSLGVGSYTYLAPNPVIQGSLTIQAMVPIIHLYSPLAYRPFDMWQALGGDASFSTNLTNANYIFYMAGGAFKVINNNGSANFILQSSYSANQATMFLDENEDFNISGGNAGRDTNIYAKRFINLSSPTTIPTGTPVSGSTCTAHQIEVDDGHIYVCNSSGSWTSAALGAL